jgi:hypothetical protein
VPSPLDVDAQEDVARVIAELGKSDKANFVLNLVDARASLLTRETLLRLGKMVPDSPIRPVESDSEPILREPLAQAARVLSSTERRGPKSRNCGRQ